MANEQILIVEDQRAVAGALKLRLRGLGYHVSAIARDGPEAIERAGELKPDLILMDVQLGEGMDGIEAARHIRARQEVPIIFISAHVDADLLERARATRPAGFINKPFTTRDLLTAVELALTRSPSDSPSSPVEAAAEARGRDGVITADSEGRIGFADPAAEYLTGLPRRQLVGRPVAEILARLYDRSPVEMAEAVMRVMHTGAEEGLLRPRGGRFGGQEPGTDILTPLHDARGQTYGLALRLITSRTHHAADRPGVERAALKALDALPHGVLVIDAESRVRHANRSARETLARHRGLELRNESPGLIDKVLDQRLQELLEQALARSRAGEDKATGVLGVPSPTAGTSLELLVAPVPVSAEGTQEPQALIYLFDGGAQRQVSFDVLTGLYGLTHTEAKLVQLMTNGMTLDDAAEELEISVNTARTHLKHVFHKTGINRQTELIHRIESGPAPLRVVLDPADPAARR